MKPIYKLLLVALAVLAVVWLTLGVFRPREKEDTKGVETVGAIQFPGPAPGVARASVTGDAVVLENDVLSATWSFEEDRIGPREFLNKLSDARLDAAGSECFQIELCGGKRLKSSDFKIVSRPVVAGVGSRPQAARQGERANGRKVTALLRDPAGDMEVEWSALLRDGSNYIKQTVAVRLARSIEISRLVLHELPGEGARAVGSVRGSPVVAGDMFFGYEDPMSENEVVASGGRNVLRCSLPFHLAPALGVPAVHSSVWGVIAPGQLRRSFLHYLERERAQPYRTFLHHNNGEDLGLNYWKTRAKDPEAAVKYRMEQEKMWTETIEAFERELIKSRDVVMDSFVHDFAWDDEKLVWLFHEGYPHGFDNVKKLVSGMGSSLGIWFSPWGGYPGKADRIKYGQAMGFEVNPIGLALAGPRYYSRFRLACLDMIQRADVNHFKFDGIAPGNNKAGPESYASEIEALCRLITELRSLKPDVFVNVSTGSWPSPFWLWHADVIWRAGSDAGVQGRGSERQKWITYRDANTYGWTVKRGPLFPISSLMLHGIMLNTGGRVTTFEPRDLIDEIHSFFATGTSLQELYIAPSLMNKESWDALAEAARWSRANADVLADTHWVGGDPGQYQVYGWASWSKRKGILALRNPDYKAAGIEVDIAQAFELPPGAAQEYRLKSPWSEDAAKDPVEVRAGTSHKFELAPFQIVVFDATPK